MKLFIRKNIWHEPILYRYNAGCKGVSYSVTDDNTKEYVYFKTVDEFTTYWNKNFGTNFK